jgi:hypothetical protein
MLNKSAGSVLLIGLSIIGLSNLTAVGHLFKQQISNQIDHVTTGNSWV